MLKIFNTMNVHKLCGTQRPWNTFMEQKENNAKHFK